jgi:TM2 domain-containing membrane protein YozV
MNKVLQYIPEAQGEEFFYLEKICEQMDDSQMSQFSSVYRARRRDPQNVLMLSIIGFFVAGLQRFYVGQIGWGIAFFFTAGFCFVGTIVDIMNHKELAFEYNQRIAEEVVRMV